MLISALITGKFVSLLKIPKVTGYLLIGFVLGPGLGYLFPEYSKIILSSEIKDIFRLIGDIGLALIIFNIGVEFKLEQIKKLGKKIFFLSFGEIVLTFLIVSSLIFITFYFTSHLLFLSISFFQLVIYSILIGIIAIETAPAATLLVIREYESEGPLTHHVIAMIGLNSIVCLILFRVVMSGYISGTYLLPIGEILLSAGIGFVMGLLMSLTEKWLEKSPELLMLVIGGITLTMGVTYGVETLIKTSYVISFHLSNLISCLFMGIVLINSTTKGDASFRALKNADLPVYALFFVLAGANLHLDILISSGLIFIFIVLIYVLGRSSGKILGSIIAVRVVNLFGKLKSLLGFALLTHAGVAIGLAYVLKSSLGEDGLVMSNIIFSAVMLFEIMGPLFTKYALTKSGEVKEISLSANRFFITKRRYQKVIIRLQHSLGIQKWRMKHHKEILCRDVMRTSVEAILDTVPFDEVLQFAAECKYDHFPVINKDHEFVGSISYSEIRDILLDEEFVYLIIARDIMKEYSLVTKPDDTLETVLNKFHTSGEDLDYIPVIDHDDPPHLIGMVTQKDVISAFRRAKRH